MYIVQPLGIFALQLYAHAPTPITTPESSPFVPSSLYHIAPIRLASSPALRDAPLSPTSFISALYLIARPSRQTPHPSRQTARWMGRLARWMGRLPREAHPPTRRAEQMAYRAISIHI